MGSFIESKICHTKVMSNCRDLLLILIEHKQQHRTNSVHQHKLWLLSRVL